MKTNVKTTNHGWISSLGKTVGPFLRRPAESLIRRIIDQRIYALTGLIPNTELAEEDVFIVGFMKSGTTWFSNLVAGVIYGANSEHIPYSLIRDLVSNHGAGKPYYKRYYTPMFFRSHNLPRPDYRRVVYLLRDGRDVMVSYFHFFRNLQRREIDFLKLVRGQEPMTPRWKWHQHVEAWLANPYQADLLVIRYEDLKADPIRELRRFCAFVGVERDDAFLELVVQKASFESMRQKEARYGIGNPQWPTDRFFVRRGVVGSHKDEMPAEALAAFLQEAGDTLRKLGYL